MTIPEINRILEQYDITIRYDSERIEQFVTSQGMQKKFTLSDLYSIIAQVETNERERIIKAVNATPLIWIPQDGDH